MRRSRPSDPTFTELAERHRAEILAYLTRLLGDRHEAQDACQEAFLRAHRAFLRLAPHSNARAWLYRIATNCGLNEARRRARAHTRTATVDPDTLAATNPAFDERERRHTVFRAVQALPPRQRSALMLRQFQGLGYAEIAASLGGNEAAARANVYQAIKRLRAVLGGKP